MRAPARLAILSTFLLAACGADEPGSGGGPTVEPSETVAGPLADRGEVELVADGYGFTEGPQWIPADEVLLFADNAGNTIYQVAADDTVTVFRTPSDDANGLAIDPQGRLLAAEAGARRVSRTELDGTVTPIAEQFEGVPLNQPNDIAVRSDGTIYFTDPTFGDAVARAELDFRGVFRIDPSGTLSAEVRAGVSETPNGAALSPDESHLYVSNYVAGLVWVFDVGPDGALSNQATFVSTGAGPDGIAVDSDGNVLIATEAGIEVFAPDGTYWGAIPVPQVPANCAFGGTDGRTLYITARTGLYRVQLAQPGLY